MGDRDERRGKDSFPLKDPAILRMRLVLDGLSLDMMIVGRESEAVRSHGKLLNIDLSTTSTIVLSPKSSYIVKGIGDRLSDDNL